MAVKLLGDLSASGNATFNSEVNLPSGGQIDWANGDARIIEGQVTNYSLSLQTYTGSALTTKMFIASGGNVGIGSTAPSEKLHVVGNGLFHSGANLGRIKVGRGNNQEIEIYVDDTNNIITAYQDSDSNNSHVFALDREFDGSGANYFEIRKGGSAQMHIDTSGNVGIGTTAPLEKLHVVGKINSSNNIVSNSTYTMFTGRSSRTVDDYGGLNKQYFKANLVTPGPNTTGESSAHGIADLRFQLANSAGNTDMSDIMTLRSGGNVGIGTTVPNAIASSVSTLSLGGTHTTVSGGISYQVNGSVKFYQYVDSDGLFIHQGQSGVGQKFKVNGSEAMRITSAGNVGIGLTNPSNALQVNGAAVFQDWAYAGNGLAHFGDGDTNITFDTNRVRILAGGTTKFDSNNTYVVDSAPAAPTNLSLSVVNDTVNVTFTASATSGIDSYFVFSSVAGGDYSLISMIAPDDFGATMSIIDNAFDATGTQAYRVYAVKNGIISADLTGSISYSVTSPLEPTNMSVVNLNTAFYVQWDAPSANARFVTAYNVYKHEHATESSLARSSATLIYSGNNYSYMYQISGNDNNNFHKFWVETTVV
jgi:hypothetical protein